MNSVTGVLSHLEPVSFPHPRLIVVYIFEYSNIQVDKPDGITQEMRHRAKILSHQLQRNLRQRKEREAQNKERERVKDELVLCNEFFKKKRNSRK